MLNTHDLMGIIAYVNISDLLLLIKLFKVNTLLILILLAIRVSYLTDSSVVQRSRPGMDGRLMVMVV